MNSSKQTQALSGVLFILAVIAAVVWFNFKKPGKPPPSAPGYYTGPFRSKGDPTVFATDDGKVVEPPAGTPKEPPKRFSPFPTSPKNSKSENSDSGSDTKDANTDKSDSGAASASAEKPKVEGKASGDPAPAKSDAKDEPPAKK